MSWLDDLSSRGGPLTAAAKRFIAHHRGAPVGLGSPEEGLEALVAATVRWAETEDASEAEDDAFVEGCGALLGLWLIHAHDGEHITDGERHAIRVGLHGFFDPFDAVDQALDDQSPTETLQRASARARAEAVGEDGVGRVMRLLTADERIAQIRFHFGPRVTFEDGSELDLTRTLRAIEGESEQTAVLAVQKLISMIQGGPGGETPWEEARERLLPRLVRPGFSAAQAAGLASRPLFGGMVESALVLAYSGRARFVRQDELQRWGLQPDNALRLAVENLARRSQAARFTRIETPHGPVIEARTGDGLDGARLLLPTLHEVLSPELGAAFFCGVPHRDALYACAATTGGPREALKTRISADFHRAPHPTSEALFLVDGRGLRPA